MWSNGRHIVEIECVVTFYRYYSVSHVLLMTKRQVSTSARHLITLISPDRVHFTAQARTVTNEQVRRPQEI